MILKRTHRFDNDAKQIDKNQQIELKNILLNIVDATDIKFIKCESFIGFPYIFKIDFNDKCIVFCYSNITNTIELSGIVPEGSELTLFF